MATSIRQQCPQVKTFDHYTLPDHKRTCPFCSAANPWLEEPPSTPTQQRPSHTDMTPIVIPDDSPLSIGNSSTFDRDRPSGRIVSSITQRHPQPFPGLGTSLQEARIARQGLNNFQSLKQSMTRGRSQQAQLTGWCWKITFHIVHFVYHQDMPNLKVYHTVAYKCSWIHPTENAYFDDLDHYISSTIIRGKADVENIVSLSNETPKLISSLTQKKTVNVCELNDDIYEVKNTRQLREKLPQPSPASSTEYPMTIILPVERALLTHIDPDEDSALNVEPAGRKDVPSSYSRREPKTRVKQEPVVSKKKPKPKTKAVSSSESLQRQYSTTANTRATRNPLRAARQEVQIIDATDEENIDTMSATFREASLETLGVFPSSDDDTEYPTIAEISRSLKALKQSNRISQGAIQALDHRNDEPVDGQTLNLQSLSDEAVEETIQEKVHEEADGRHDSTGSNLIQAAPRQVAKKKRNRSEVSLGASHYELRDREQLRKQK